ncbi:MAG: energy transducer TonB [Burkholderiaceae bacterium]
MRPSALAAAIVLHAVLIAVVVSGALHKQATEVEPPKVLVQLITPPAKPEPPPPEPPKPKPPKAEPPKPQPPKPEPVKPPPRPEPTRPEPPRQEAVKPEPHPEPVKIEPPPAPVAAPPAPVSPPAPPPPAPPAPPTPKPSARTEVSISASYAAANRKPEYPKMSLRLGEQGTVVLIVMVKSDGSAGDVEVKSSSGFGRLDRAAADAVKTWRFNPATVDGKAVDKSYEVPITFKPPN